MNFYGKEYQDQFAYHLIGSQGFFLDVGCYHPFLGNNTYALESIGWDGLLFDIGDDWVNLCRQYRQRKAFCVDVTTNEFSKIIKDNTDVRVFDYISMDVDNASVGGITQLLENDISFKCMTFEHDLYDCGDIRKAPAQKVLEEHGYVALFENVLTDGTGKGVLEPWEDWWINPKHFPSEILQLQAKDIFYKDCVEAVIKFQEGNL